MSKVLTGKVQGGAQDRSFALKGQVLIDGVQQVVDITGTFKIVNSNTTDLYMGEFRTGELTAIFCISHRGDGVFITKQAEGPFAGLESGGIKAKFSLWVGKEQDWTLTFGPLKKSDHNILFLWNSHAPEYTELIFSQIDKIRAIG